MESPLHRLKAWMPALCVILPVALPAAAGAQAAYSPRPTIGESISSGVGKIGEAMTPKTPVTPADDPVALRGTGKPSIETYVALARFYEEQGKYPDSEAQYKRAMQESPNDLRALLGYARLKDRMGEPQEALKLYQRAAREHPKEPSVMNNLAVHYAREGMLRDAIGALDQAIQLRPKDPKYRNNLAALLVELGRPQEAFGQLRAVHDEAAAHYNLGFLLNRKGQTQAAAQEFAIALRINPSLVQARQWLERIHGMAAQGPRPAPQDPQSAMQPPRMGPQGAPPEARLGRPAAVSGGPPVVEYPPLTADRRAVEAPPQFERPAPRAAASPPQRSPYDPPARPAGVYARPDPRGPTVLGPPPAQGNSYPETSGLRPPQYGPRVGEGNGARDGNGVRPSGVRQLPPPPPQRAPQQDEPPPYPGPDDSRLPERLPPTTEVSGPELMAPMPPGR